MEHVYKFRIFPTLGQELQIQETFTRCSDVYNYFLGEQLERAKTGREPLGVVEAIESLERLGREKPELSPADSAAVRGAALEACAKAAEYRRRAEKNGEPLPGRPAPDSPRHSYQLSASDQIEINNGLIRLPGLGAVPCAVAETRPLSILSASISQGASGYYQVAIRCIAKEDEQGVHPQNAPMSLSIGCFDPVECAHRLAAHHQIRTDTPD